MYKLQHKFYLGVVASISFSPKLSKFVMRKRLAMGLLVSSLFPRTMECLMTLSSSPKDRSRSTGWSGEAFIEYSLFLVPTSCTSLTGETAAETCLFQATRTQLNIGPYEIRCRLPLGAQWSHFLPFLSLLQTSDMTSRNETRFHGVRTVIVLCHFRLTCSRYG